MIPPMRSVALYVLILWKQPSFKQTSETVSHADHRSASSRQLGRQQQMPGAHTSWECVEAQWGKERSPPAAATHDAWHLQTEIELVFISSPRELRCCGFSSRNPQRMKIMNGLASLTHPNRIHPVKITCNKLFQADWQIITGNAFHICKKWPKNSQNP